MTDIAAPLVFLSLTALALGTWWMEGRSASAHRRSATALIALFVLANGIVAFSGRSLWPIAAWNLMASTMPSEVTLQRLVAVDETGQQHGIDHRTWAPLSEEELMAWIRGRFTRLSPVDRQDALRDLHRRAESGRERATSGLPIAESNAPLGSRGASTHLLHPRRWDSAEVVPSERFVGIQVVEDRWNVRTPGGSAERERVVLFEFMAR